MVKLIMLSKRGLFQSGTRKAMVAVKLIRDNLTQNLRRGLCLTIAGFWGLLCVSANHPAGKCRRSFGSFFGPSEPIVAKRIIEEARAREEAEMVAARAQETEETERRIAAKVHSGHSGGTNSKSSVYLKSSGYTEEPKVAKPIHEATRKAQKLKEARDYSFLFSSTDPVSHAPESKPSVASKQVTTTHGSRDQQKKQVTRSRSPPSRKLLEKPKARGNQEVRKKMEGLKLQSGLPKKQAPGPDKNLKARPHSSLAPRPKSVSVPSSATNRGVNQSKAENKPKASMVSPSSKQVSGSREAPKKVTGPGRPSNSLPSSRSPERKHIATGKSVEGNKSKSMDRQGLAIATRADAIPMRKALPANTNKPSSSRSGDQGRRVLDDGFKKPALKAKTERILEKSATPKSSQLSRPGVSRKRQAKDSDDESEDSFLVDDEEDGAGGGYSGVSDYIRKMFRYNPSKYRDVDDGDDRDMEVGFNRIQAEERRSARIAREEDDREAQLLEEEERAERARKLKRLKTNKK
ncbi:hypothetical protein O6H91_17G015400 [Diphasiastrum complanatum]|uniref:Uncharacterized protein n=1 Tax=Diphasiastrum complanatum TaxID=34168 RepID=A0ACC2B4K7_DIPCM|nr:hypothetical protein O6H91_17G015400 [Diphasiastrum complanatum]